jgi:hypothetical protein
MTKWLLIGYAITVSLGLAYTKILTLERDALKYQIKVIEASYQEQADTIKGLTTLNTSLAAANEAAIASEREINEKTQRIAIELNRLRYTEAQRALEAPFERGNAASKRRAAAIMRFTGADRSAQGASDTQASYPRRTSSPGNRDPTTDPDNR